MNWPNFISVCRVVAVPLFIYLLFYDHKAAAFLTFIIAGASDALDGFLARVLNQKTILGTFLDPMADKLLAATAFVAAAGYGLIPVWFLIIVISRDVILSLGALVTYFVTGSLEIQPRILGKATTFFQFLTISLALARPVFSVPADLLVGTQILTTVLTVISGIQYIYAGLVAVGSEI